MFFAKELRLLAALIFCVLLLDVDARVLRRDESSVAPKKTASVASSKTLPAFTLMTNRPAAINSDVRILEDATISENPIDTSSTSISSQVTAVAKTTSVSSIAASLSPTISDNVEPSNTSALKSEATESTIRSNELPISPRITPASGIGGLILMISGLIYTLIGIKFKWLHASLSVAYLSALSVAVLIVYVANPPVSDAIQGGYLVAIVVTGTVLGGVSYFFCDITEGLASLLGGFCFSMWLLVMKPGGLIRSSGGKVALIIVFTVVAYSTSFHRLTKDYSLICSIAFGGATIVVLGIDCFASAGLKEFWIYLWDVNPDLFPKGTKTYPLTKGMKLEISAVAVIFLIGLVSQVRLWKIMQKRQARRGSGKLDLEEDGQVSRDELVIANKVEKEVAQEMPQWKASYDEKALPDPGQHPANRDSGYGAMDLKAKERWTTSTLRASDFEASASPVVERGGIELSIDVIQPVPESIPTSLPAELPKPSVIPEVVPLPFEAPKSDIDEEDRVSVAATVEEQVEMKQRSARFSATSAFLRRLSKKSRRSSQGLYRGEGDSSEDLVSLRTVDNHRSSSIAATQDDLSDIDDFRSARSSYQMSPYKAEFNRSSIGGTPSPRTPNFSHKITGSRLSRPFSGITAASNLDAEPVPELPTELIQEKKAPTSSVEEIKQETDSNDSASQYDSEPQEIASEQLGASEVVLNEETLPRMSRVAMSYRTNEWAKHLATAETPSAGETINQSEKNGIQDTEKPVPIDIVALQETGNIPSPPNPRTSSELPTPTRSASAQSKLLPQAVHEPKSRTSTTKRRDSGIKGKQFIGSGTALATMPEFPQATLSSSEAVSSLYTTPVHWSSHQPKYQPTIPNPMLARESRLASWRASIAQDKQAGIAPRSSIEMSRNALLQERLAREHKRETAAKMKSLKEAAFDEKMRRGDMLEAHRDALRKMQARANRSVE